MKKIYLIAIILAQSVLSFTQVNPGFFEFRLTNPGGEPGTFRIQARAISSVVPTQSDFLVDLGFGIWWNNVANPTIADIDVVTATSICAAVAEESPAPGNSSGSGTPNGLVVNASMQFFCPFPSDWVQWQWVNIANITICSVNNCSSGGPPSGIDAEDFLIQGFTSVLPVINVNGEEYTPSSAPLPLNLIAFDARKSGDKSAHLTWTTVNEENTSHFVVQRSFDKRTWNNVGNVAAAGYSVDVRNYELTDVNVYNGVDTRREVYYRLIMADLDGTSKPSPVRSVVFGSTTKASEFAVFPNPATNGVHVEWNESGYDQPTALEFFDVSGKLIYSQEVGEGSTQEYIDFTKTTIQPGLYMLRIMNGTEAIEHKRIVVAQP